MQLLEFWLRSFVNPSITTDELSHHLTTAGLKVEEVDPVASPFSQIIVGHVVEVSKHPDVDCLNVCKADTGMSELLQIVCGALDVSAGIKVSYALVGTDLPPGGDGKPFKIRIDKLHGVESYDTPCSACELKLPEDHDGLLILPEDMPVDEDIHKVLDLDGQIFVIKLTPNKTDRLSIHDMAHEVSALMGAPITVPSMAPVAVTPTDKLPVKVEALDLCGRFSGRIIRGVNAYAEIPTWMVSHIGHVNMCSASALADISNYAILELGRPSYMFDLDRIHGDLTVRWGKAGEQLKLFNGDTITVDEKAGVISDEWATESLAGVMDGDKTAVALGTWNIYVEAAFWWPGTIQDRARHYDLSTDAGHRFEHGVNYTIAVEYVERINALILEICGGQAGPINDQIVDLPKHEPVRMCTTRAARVLGTPLSHDVVADVFKRLDFTFSVDGDAFIVKPPLYHFDLEIKEDLTEEVARIYGSERILARPPVAENAMCPTDGVYRIIRDVRHAATVRDYHEVVDFASVETERGADFAGNTGPISLLNPIASQYSVVCSTLIGDLLDRVCYSLNRKASRVHTFEVGCVFHRDATVADDGLSVAEYVRSMMVGGTSYGPTKEGQ